jgi:hypothetical protein
VHCTFFLLNRAKYKYCVVAQKSKKDLGNTFFVRM